MSSPAEEAARRRREKILARGQDRMKFVSGEVKALDTPSAEPSEAPAASAEKPLQAAPAEASPQPVEASDATTTTLESAAAPAVSPVTPQATIETKARWERKWEKDVSAVKETREISQETLESLKKTEEMAVEAPRAEKSLAARSTPVVSPKGSWFPNIKLDSLVVSLVVVALGVLSGASQGQFIQDNLWLPMGSFLLFALLIRVVFSVSFNRFGLVSKKQEESASSGGLLDMGLRMLPPQIQELVGTFRKVSGYFKDSYDDMMLFIFAHGVSSRLYVKA